MSISIVVVKEVVIIELKILKYDMEIDILNKYTLSQENAQKNPRYIKFTCGIRFSAYDVYLFSS